MDQFEEWIAALRNSDVGLEAAAVIGPVKRASVKYRGACEEESIPAMEGESLHGMRESRLDHVNSELSTP
jgi:hypothetical protein